MGPHFLSTDLSIGIRDRSVASLLLEKSHGKQINSIEILLLLPLSFCIGVTG